MTKWKITSQFLGEKKMFAVYRNLKDYEPDHSGNREYATGYMESKEQAQAIADEMNEKGEQK
ncbi:MAG: hypothetical protein ACI4MZ_03740 [Christensenellales bacterium]